MERPAIAPGAFQSPGVGGGLADGPSPTSAAPADSGMKMNELHPERYPASCAVAGKTRDELQAETLESIRTGDIWRPATPASG
jgi:hypothetical protein